MECTVLEIYYDMLQKGQTACDVSIRCGTTSCFGLYTPVQFSPVHIKTKRAINREYECVQSATATATGTHWTLSLDSNASTVDAC